jgi:hypothetical protein
MAREDKECYVSEEKCQGCLNTSCYDGDDDKTPAGLRILCYGYFAFAKILEKGSKLVRLIMPEPKHNSKLIEK